MSPKLQAVKDALERMDKASPYGFAYDELRKAFLVAVSKAGFDPKRAAEDWGRYQVAVGEAADQIDQPDEPEPESMELFG